MNAWNNSVWYRESHSARELLNTFLHPVNIFCNVFDLVLLTNLTLSLSTYSLFSIHTKKTVIFLLKNILIYNFYFYFGPSHPPKLNLPLLFRFRPSIHNKLVPNFPTFPPLFWFKSKFESVYSVLTEFVTKILPYNANEIKQA